MDVIRYRDRLGRGRDLTSPLYCSVEHGLGFPPQALGGIYTTQVVLDGLLQFKPAATTAFWLTGTRAGLIKKSTSLTGVNVALRPCPWHPWRFGIRMRWHANAKADLHQGLRDAKRLPCTPGIGRRSAFFHRLRASDSGLFRAGNLE